MVAIIFLAIFIILLVVSLVVIVKHIYNRKKFYQKVKFFQCAFAFLVALSLICLSIIMPLAISRYQTDNQSIKECKVALKNDSWQEIKIFPEKLICIKASSNYEAISSIFLNKNVESCYIFRRSYMPDVFFIGIKTNEEKYSWYEFEFELKRFLSVKEITNLK